MSELIAALEGKLVNVEGIEVALKPVLSRIRPGHYTGEILGVPTKKGKRTKAYREQADRLGDHYVMSWTGELPDEVTAQI
jgi:hypothetical protein